MTRFILVVAALFSVACAAVPDWRMVNGATADDGQFPHQVSLRQFGTHTCGGSILDENFVVTAAHCVAGSKPNYMSVVVGTNKLNAGGDIYKVKKVTTYDPEVDLKDLKNDIALLEIEGEIEFGAKVQPIALETAAVVDGSDVILSGWGRTGYPGNIPIDLQFLTLETTDPTQCKKDLEGSGIDMDETKILCTKGKNAGEGICHGDSGGPIVTSDGAAPPAYKLVGIVSWGRPCGGKYPDVHTRVSEFVGWISSNKIPSS